MKLKESHQHLLFPTPIWQYILEDCDELNDRLIQDIDGFDWPGYMVEQGLDLGDDLNSRSEDMFIPINRAPGLMIVLNQALAFAAEAADQYGWDLEQHKLQIEQFWVNLNKPHGYNMQHNHAPNHISGVYYVQVPAQSGDIKFFDDRKLRDVCEPGAVRDSALAYSSYTFRPSAGLMFLFPGWLDHLVGQNKSEQDRISISFNIDLVEK